MKSIDLVREFHVAFGQAIESKPVVNDYDRNVLRMDLLQEELDELGLALSDRDPVAVLDALTDLQYVLDGAYLSLGFAHVKEAALAEVHRSNLSKLDANGKPIYRADGKILKGPNYSPPDLAAVLADIVGEPTTPKGGVPELNRFGLPLPPGQRWHGDTFGDDPGPECSICGGPRGHYGECK